MGNADDVMGHFLEGGITLSGFRREGERDVTMWFCWALGAESPGEQ